ncbi:MAG: DNA repair protein RecN [Myxococcota bacterium]
MLTCLRVQQLAIAEDIELTFGTGLNIVTGETGAGKSLLVKALSLVLGGRGRSELVREGAAQANVEALFDVSSSPETQTWLDASFGLSDSEVLIRRVLSREGRTRAYINGRLATASQVKRIGERLLDISSQHDHHRLVDPRSHLEFLDRFGHLEQPRRVVAEAWTSLRVASRALLQLESDLQTRAEREDLLRFQVEELEAVAPQLGEETALTHRCDQLAHAEQLSGATQHAHQTLYDNERSVAAQLAELTHTLHALHGVDPQLDALTERIDALMTDIEDVGQDFGQYARQAVMDPEELRHSEERLGVLRRLGRKHGTSPDDLATKATSLREELDAMATLELEVESVEAARDAAFDAVSREARSLSEARKAAAGRLGASITSELSTLGMGDAEVKVDVAMLPHRDGSPELDGAHLSETGVDQVEFLIAPNHGQSPRPLHRIASGGELSRALLAIKCVLAHNGPRGVYVFDEVDTGVGGAIAEAIGQKLWQLSRHHQILCITHQAQLAAYGDQHLHVSKARVGDSTQSTVRALRADDRVHELARMMGGLRLNEATTHAARGLLTDAENVKTDIRSLAK